MMQLNAKQSFFIVVSGYLLGSLTLWSNSWGEGIYIIYICAATLVQQLPDRLLRPWKHSISTSWNRRQQQSMITTKKVTQHKPDSYLVSRWSKSPRFISRVPWERYIVSTSYSYHNFKM